MRNDRKQFALPVLVVLALFSMGTDSRAQDHDAHQGHDMTSHDMSGHDMSAMPTTGSWSYLDRDNADVTLWDRWETVPVEGTSGAFQAASGMSLEARCAALLASKTVMIDRTLRAACGDMTPAPTETDGSTADHQQHHDH